MKNLINATMESNILDELASFNIKAPIAFSISFEDSNEGEEVTVKSENVTDDDNINSQESNDLPQILLSPKKEIKEELRDTVKEQSSENELNSDQHLEQNISKDITTLHTEILHNTESTSDKKKRKQEQLQIYKNKRSKKDTQENVLNDFSSHGIDLVHQDVDTSQSNPISVVSTAALLSPNERERENTKSRIISTLNVLSENMRLVMETYAYYKQCNTPCDSYKKQKFKYFNESYNAVVKIIIPEEQNRDFIFAFLHKTYQHALKNPGLNKCCFDDYVILLKELINWAKEKQKLQTPSKQDNTVQPSLNQATRKQKNYVQTELTGSNCQQEVFLETTCTKTVDDGVEADSICIFTAGPPKSEISISIDPSLNKYLTTTNSFTSHSNEASARTPQKSSVELSKLQMPLQTQLETQANNKNHTLQQLLQRPPQIQQMPNFTSNDPSHFYPEMYKYMHTARSPVKKNPTKKNILTKQKNTRQPQVQRPIEKQNENNMPAQSQHPQQELMPSPQMRPQQQPPVNTAHRQSTHAPSIYDQSTRPPPPRYDKAIWTQTLQQHENSLQMQPHYDPLRNIQQLNQPQHHMLPQPNTLYEQYLRDQNNIRLMQNMQSQHEKLQRDQSMTGQLQNMHLQYGSLQQVQNNKGHMQNMQPEYGPLQVQSTIRQLQNMQPQYGSLQQVQNKKRQHQNMQTQHVPLQVHSTIGQFQNMHSQYGQLQQDQSKIGYLQNMQPRYEQVPTRQSQPMLPQQVPQHVSPQIGQPSPIPPDCEQRPQMGEWRQGLTELYHHQAQTQQMHRNAPRSNSTDSGFVSPLNFNTTSDQTVPPVPDETESSQILITHVTSLNPKVPFMAEGTCVICNKTTKKVCMGCMKVYYCTYECQVQDWTSHGPDCCNQGPTTTSMRETNDVHLPT